MLSSVGRTGHVWPATMGNQDEGAPLSLGLLARVACCCIVWLQADARSARTGAGRPRPDLLQRRCAQGRKLRCRQPIRSTVRAHGLVVASIG